MSTSVELSVIVPVFNEEKNILAYLKRTVPVLAQTVGSYEILFVVDPSSDDTSRIIEEESRSNPSVKMLELSRRFGQPMATVAGLDYAVGKAVVVMDVDLQDPPEVIPELVDRWRSGFKVVLAQRRRREGETVAKRVIAKLGYAFINRFSDVPIPRDTGDFRLLDRRVVDELKRFPEGNGFLRGLVALVGFNQTSVFFDRPRRFAGKGSYNRFTGSLRIGLNGVFGFSNALLNLATVLGMISAFLAVLGGVAYLGLKLVGFPFPVGNPTIVFLILAVGGAQLICLGIIGQYVGRIYQESLRRPRYIVARSVGL